LTVVTVKVTEVAFGATVTLDGTVADEDVLPNVTSAPPGGAGPFSVTVAVGFVKPPCTVVALSPTEATPDAGGITVRVTLWLPPPFNVAVIVAVPEAAAVVVTLKVAVVAWAGTVTLAGPLTPGILLDSATTAPPVTAGLLKVTVPVAVFPATTLAGAMETLEIAGLMAVIWSDPDVCVPL
jgi:hypothetical protein